MSDNQSDNSDAWATPKPAMSDVPLPEPDQLEIVNMSHPGVITVKGYSPSSMHAHAAAVSAAENAALQERVAELEQQNQQQRDEWLSWDAKRAGLQQDAARYRWLRDAHPADNGAWVAQGVPSSGLGYLREGVLDAAIDAAK